MTSVLRSLVVTFRTGAWSRAALQLEILALRHQLEVLQRTRPLRVRLANLPARRAAAVDPIVTLRD